MGHTENRSFPKLLLRKALLGVGLLAYFTVAFYVMKRTGVPCVFVYFLGIPCPGCGMTRAMYSLLSLDLVAAWNYNPLIFAKPYVMSYVFFEWKHPIHKRLLLGVGIGAIVNWLINIIANVVI